MNMFQRFTGLLKGSAGKPQTAYFQGGRNPLMVSWRPQLRESAQDIQVAWTDAASRAKEGIQNSGFLTKIVETETGSVVGAGLRLACRPDTDALGWSAAEGAEWARRVERAFRLWAEKPTECDAAGKMTFSKMQQAAFGSYKTFGEILALMPVINRPQSTTKTKVLLIPPSRLTQKTEMHENIVQGVKTDGWGFPKSYFINEYQRNLGWREREISAFDVEGRPNVVHIFDSSISTNRGISPMAPILKVVRQVDQFADASLVKALIQTIFAATLQTNIQGVTAFDGLLTTGDTASTTNLDGFAALKGEWYDGAKIDLTQHGRIGHLFPGDELKFTESKTPGQAYDDFMGWLMREIAAGSGVTYESATGDYRGATYSSIRMAGAIEWLTVLRRRANIIVPFCQAVFSAWLDEAVFTGRIPFKGGYLKYVAMRDAATRSVWSGPAQPQADDFKAARSHEVLKDMGATTLSEISAAYGRDWDDDMRQRAEENKLAEELGLPLPWAPKDKLETKDGQALELNAPTDGTGEKKDQNQRKKSTRRGGGRDPAEQDPADASADDLKTVVENELQTSIEGE